MKARYIQCNSYRNKIENCAIRRTLTAEVWRTQGCVLVIRLGPAGQSRAGFVERCAGREDVWPDLTVTGRIKDGESGKDYVWPLNWEDLEGKKKMRRPQERKRQWGFMRTWAGSHWARKLEIKVEVGLESKILHLQMSWAFIASTEISGTCVHVIIY